MRHLVIQTHTHCCCAPFVVFFNLVDYIHLQSKSCSQHIRKCSSFNLKTNCPCLQFVLHVTQFHSCLESSWRVFLDKSEFSIETMGDCGNLQGSKETLRRPSGWGTYIFPSLMTDELPSTWLVVCDCETPVLALNGENDHRLTVYICSYCILS